MEMEITELLKQAEPRACNEALKRLGLLNDRTPDFQKQQAPNSQLHPAKDAREVWKAFFGWSKLTVPSDSDEMQKMLGENVFPNTMYSALYGWRYFPFPEKPLNIGIETDVSLPDEWEPSRNYHHAWYAMQAVFEKPTTDQLWLRADIVGHSCDLFINGEKAGHHIGGYTPFEFNITSHIKQGANEIALLVQDDTAIIDWGKKAASGQLDGGAGPHNAHHSGIRGGIYFELRKPVHIAKIRINTSFRKKTLSVESWLRKNHENAEITHQVYQWPYSSKAVLTLPGQKIKTTGDDGKIEQKITWEAPKLWSPACPNLYILRTTVSADGFSETIDTRFGFREFWIENTHFVLNGKRIRLLGDGGMSSELLSIVPDKSVEFTRETLAFYKQKFNFMSARLHGILCPSWCIHAADEAGVLIINQSGLREGERRKYENGGAKFRTTVEKEFEEWYWRDVNNPSVVIWDVENELARGKETRESEMMETVLGLDNYIRKHDPNAIIQHSGAAWYHPDQEIIHVHMQEQYSRVMRSWKENGKVPLLLGEFWMGGRGETRLPNSFEYLSREDWHREEARLYREQMLEMRFFGVNGMMPHRLTRWPVFKRKPLLAQADVKDAAHAKYEWRFESFKNYGARGLAPIVAFAWPRVSTVVADSEFERQVVVCNDSENEISLKVSLVYGAQTTEFDVTLAPANQQMIPVKLLPDPSAGEIKIEARALDGTVIESDNLEINVLPPEAVQWKPGKRRIVVVPSIDASTERALQELGIAFEISKSLPEDARNTIVLLPPDSEPDALGKTCEQVKNYLSQGGRILALNQTEDPRWLPLRMPFGSARRTSMPEFNMAGWDEVNKDLIYAREIPVYAKNHPVFSNLSDADFKEWSPLDGRISDDVFVLPNALNMTAGAEFRPLLGAARRENSSLVEFRVGGGTGLLCQAQVLQQRSHPAATALLFNMLSYLDGAAWESKIKKVGIAGNLSVDLLASITGLDKTNFASVEPGEVVPDLVLVGEGAETGFVCDLAEQGSCVVLLSCAAVNSLPGYQVHQGAEFYYSGTRSGIQDHPLMWGIASASFLPLKQTPVKGEIFLKPPNAEVIMAGHCKGHSPFANDWTVDIGFYGLEAREEAHPIATCQKIGKGELIATTFEPGDAKSALECQFFTNLLANAGVELPVPQTHSSTVIVKKTIPLNFDGRLDDWINDMEDITFSEYCHATPIVLSSKDVTVGHAESDAQLSAIVYFLYDKANLYFGGIVFSSEDSCILTLHLSETTLEVDIEKKQLTLNGAATSSGQVVFGSQMVKEIPDTRLLSLIQIHRQTAKPVVLSDKSGVTFESFIPFKDLGHEAPPETLHAFIQVSQKRGNCTLQTPLPSGDKPEFLTLKME